jgi:hypothetical protein
VKHHRGVETQEEQDAGEHRAVKRIRDVEKLPQEKHTFSYEYINTSPRDTSQSAPEQPDVQTTEEYSSRTPQPTSANTPSQVQTPAQTESSQRNGAQSRTREIAEERAINGTPTPSTLQQPAIERTDAQTIDKRSDTQHVSQQRPAPRNRSKRTPPLPTLKHPHTPKQQLNSEDYLSDEYDDFDDTLVLPSAYRSQEAARLVAQTKTSQAADHSKTEQSQQRHVREGATPKFASITGQGLSDARSAQGTARNDGEIIPSDPAEREAYLQKRFGKHRTKVLQPHTKAILSMGPVEVYDESEHEEDIEDPFTRDDFREWKMDLKVARKAYRGVLGGERLPSPEPSSKAKAKQIVSFFRTKH